MAIPRQSPGQLDAYLKRWKALDDLIRETTNVYEYWPKPIDNPKGSAFGRQETILTLLGSLRKFGERQFKFFYYGLDPAAQPDPDLPRPPRLKPWDEFPAEDILTGILGQIGNDLELIQRAATQRITAGRLIHETLERADKLAWCALQPAIAHNIIDRPASVLTHFQKTPGFYAIPYANVAIIGIPYTCAADQMYQDYLAIPHEVGHYVYRNPVKQVRQDLKNLRLHPPVEPAYQEWFKTVFEEMSADIYGCLVAGPVMARDFEDLALANSQESFSYNDGQHPNPAVRPLIYCEVLQNPVATALAESEQGAWHDIGQRLATQWRDQLYGRHTSEFFVKSQRRIANGQLTQTQGYNIAETLPVAAQLKSSDSEGTLAGVAAKIIDALLKQLADYIDKYDQAPEKTKKLAGWAGVLAASVQPDELLQLYEDHFLDLLGQCQAPPEAPQPDKNPWDKTSDEDPWDKWMEKNEVFPGGWPAGPIPSGEVKDPDKMQPNSWGYILWANGWSTEGPSTDRGHPEV